MYSSTREKQIFAWRECCLILLCAPVVIAATLAHVGLFNLVLFFFQALDGAFILTRVCWSVGLSVCLQHKLYTDLKPCIQHKIYTDLKTCLQHKIYTDLKPCLQHKIYTDFEAWQSPDHSVRGIISQKSSAKNINKEANRNKTTFRTHDQTSYVFHW